jgi:4-amino-4-deoxychorismate lyase
MQDGDGHVVCGTMSNLFLRTRFNVLMTPLLDRCGVAGVMRRWILEQADQIETARRGADRHGGSCAMPTKSS